MAEAVVHIFDEAVIIQVEHLAGIHPYPEIETPHPKRTAFRRNSRVGRTHVTRHAATPGKIRPFRKFTGDMVCLPIPGESIRAGRGLRPGRAGIEADFDGLVEETERGEIYSSSSSSFSNLSTSTS